MKLLRNARENGGGRHSNGTAAAGVAGVKKPPGKASEEQLLIEAARAGSAAAWEELYQRHKGWIWRKLWASYWNRADAEDALQEIWLKMHKALPALDRGCPLEPYLRRVVGNHSIDGARMRTRRAARAGGPVVSLDDTIVGRQGENRPLIDVVAPLNRLGEEDQRLLAARVDEAMAKLDPNERKILWLDADGLTLEQLAGELKLGSITTAQRRLKEAQERFAALFG